MKKVTIIFVIAGLLSGCYKNNPVEGEYRGRFEEEGNVYYQSLYITKTDKHSTVINDADVLQKKGKKVTGEISTVSFGPYYGKFVISGRWRQNIFHNTFLIKGDYVKEGRTYNTGQGNPSGTTFIQEEPTEGTFEIRLVEEK